MIKEASCAAAPSNIPFVKTLPNAPTPDAERPLITYAYYEAPFARANLRFFVDHALHSAADFVFILNGDTDVDEKIIFADPEVPEDLADVLPKRNKSNVFVKRRPNTCFDLGAHYEVLNGVMGGEGWFGKDGAIAEVQGMASKGDKMLLRNRYKRFILMNASIRGPFVPRWSMECWSDSYLNRLTDKIKVRHTTLSLPPPRMLQSLTGNPQLVGMSYNCHFGEGHIQSMIWATDHTGLQLILAPGAIGECFTEMGLAMKAEVRTTQVLRDAGYEVDAFLSVYHSENRAAKWARMRAKKAAGVKQFRKRELGPGEVEGEVEVGRREEGTGEQQEQKKEVKESKAQRAEESAPSPPPKPLTPEKQAAAEAAAEAERLRKEEEARRAQAEDERRKAEALRVKKEKEAQLLLTEDNDMPGYFWRECLQEDWLKPDGYFGTFVHPYENLFMKSHRNIEDTVLDRLTEWHDGLGYESWDVCV